MIMLSIISFPIPKLTNQLTDQPANIGNFQVLVQKFIYLYLPGVRDLNLEREI
jgi:hypothetical protein